LTYIDDSRVPPPASRTSLGAGPDGSGLSDIPLKGEVCTQYIRCNKAGCRCQTGAAHGPYYYRVWREGGRVHKEYVKSENAAAVRAACESYKALSQQLRDLRHQREKIARQLQGEWRKTQRLMRSSDKIKPGA
jgi:hypothetical protein